MTEKDCELAVKELKESNLWKDPARKKLVEYVDPYWLQEKKVSSSIFSLPFPRLYPIMGLRLIR